MAKKRTVVLLALSALALSLLSACGNAATQTSEKTVKVGTVYPVSGSLAKLGQACLEGTVIAADIVNDENKGPKIELVNVDAPDATTGVNEANRLISQKGIKVIVGTYASPISLAVSDVTERNKAILWEVNAIHPQITGRGYKYVFRMIADSTAYGPAAVNFLKDVIAPKLGVKPGDLKAAVVYEDGDYGQSVADNAKKAAQEAGVPIVADIRYNAKTTNDMSAILLQLIQSKADILLAAQYDADAQLFWKQAKQFGLNLKAVIGNGGGYGSDNLVTTFGNEVDGFFNTASGSNHLNESGLSPEARQLNAEFQKRYKEKYGKEPDSYAITGFSASYVLFHDVIPKAGDDPESIRKVAQQLDFPQGYLVNGWGVKFNEAGQNTRATMTVGQWQDRQLVTVYPQSLAEKPPINIPLSRQ